MTELELTPMEPPPPILGAWSRLYALVLIELALCILLFYLFERVFS
jgi:hypothetical protein